MEENEAPSSAHFVVGLIENRAKEVGIAAFDLRTASLYLCQFIETSRSYQNTMTLLHYFEPSDIIISSSTNNVAPEGMIGVAGLLDHNDLCHARKVKLARGCFDDTKGAMLLQSLALKDYYPLSLDCYNKQYYLCLGAAAAVIKWIENEKGVIITNHSVRISFNGSCDHMSIDVTSVQNLEVIEPLSFRLGQHLNKRGSLFGILNTTRTFGGSRLLRANLLQPLKDIQTINARLDCMDELTSKEKLFFGLSQALHKFPKNLDRVLCHFCFSKRKITEDITGSASTKRSQAIVASIILLKEAIQLLPPLLEVLQHADCLLLQNIKKSMCLHPGYDQLRQRIEAVIDDDVLHSRAPFIARTQQCFAVKAGFDGFLDIARKTFCDTSEAIHALAKKYREDLILPNLKMPFNSKRGFYMSIPEKDLNQRKLPDIFIQVTKQGKNVHFSSYELMSFNTRNQRAAAECYARTEHCLEGLTKQIREDIFLLILLAESVSLMDMMVNSFAYLVVNKSLGSYNRPEFTENGPVAIEAGRHPILENAGSDEFVANSTFLSEASNMVIVTGPNMSGKSTYICQVALITIMAHIGCYVPTKFASFRVVDRLFTRIGTRDSVGSNSSTFMTEMRETAFFTQNLTARSFIFIDELGRATSSSDGLAIAWSCSEYLLSLRAYVIFATHMQRLVELSSIYPNVKICQFSAGITNNRLDFKVLSPKPHFKIPVKVLFVRAGHFFTL
ncbi:hypothetical protein O6H91_19G009400 [Diphasiastrum complanatum]|uniref:Uncharacterized protein n=1 Tax=Diphasiastrum complanatum TaxID=34168 RepID=A0ACC2ASK6_DIPCM|nr:hypothetical protein O6H91_19G009400 [Diphasiastrum complanatum]